MKSLQAIVSRSISNILLKMGFTLVPLEKHKAALRTRENFESLCLAAEAWLPQDVSLPKNTRRTELLARQYGTPPPEAYYLVHALAKTRLIDGDLCEFGVAQGEISALLASEILESEKRLHLFDSFEGLPKPTKEDALQDDVLELGSIEAYAGKMASPESFVISRLREVGFPRDRYVLHKGFFENLLPEKIDFPTRVAFAYVDFDFYEPIKQVLEFLDGVSSPGGIFIVDDYDFFSTGAKKAVDEFLETRMDRYTINVPDSRIGHFAILEKFHA